MTEIETSVRRPDRRFLLFLLGFYVAWCLRVVFLLPVDGRIETEWFRQCWSQGLRLTIWILPLVVYLRAIESVGIVRFLKLDSLPHGRRLVLGSLIIVGFLAASGVVACTFQGGGLSKLQTITQFRWLWLFTWAFLVSTVEETLYRGFIFQKLRVTWSFHGANLLTSGLFLLIHWPGWLYMQGLHWGLVPLSASILVISWVLGLLFELTRSLWPPIVLHLLNNVLSSVLLP